MKKRMMIAVLCATALVSAAAAASPRISVDASIYEFGSVMEGEFVRHVFVITNTGDERLEITRVRSTCGCTTSALPKSSLAPGEAVELEVTFDTAGYGGRTVTKTLSIESNDPQSRQLWIRMTGSVARLGPNHISQGDLQYLLYVMIDLRSPEMYDRGHIIGAINIPFVELPGYLGRLPKGFLMVLYDADGTLSDQAATLLIQNGYPDAKSLFGGYASWVENQGTAMTWPIAE